MINNDFVTESDLVIDPNYQSLYHWDNNQDAQGEIEILFSTNNPELNIEMLSVDLREGKYINVGFTNDTTHPPFLCGVLENQVDSKYVFEAKKGDQKTFSLKLKKIEDKKWNFVVVKEDPENGLLDPKTMFCLFMVDEDKTMSSKNFKYLLESSKMRFEPSMLVLGSILLQNGYSNEGILLFRIAAEYYNSSTAYLRLGSLLCYSELANMALDYLIKSVELGEEEGNYYLGELYSPFSHSLSFPNKNSAKALEYYKKYNDPLSYTAISTIYKNGDKDVHRDLKLSRRYLQMAEENEETPKKSNFISYSITALITLATVSYIAYRIFKRKMK